MRAASARVPFAADQLLLNVARNLERFGPRREPTDFIYDNRMHEKGKLIQAWDWSTTPLKRRRSSWHGLVNSGSCSAADRRTRV
jgi:hypothetical protein